MLLRLKSQNEEKIERTQQIKEIRTEMDDDKYYELQQNMFITNQKLIDMKSRKNVESQIK